ncbi:AN1-type zinc finger protein 5-like [Grus japonensis]|uniref:AN1-type zinc finger protein 5-like n=1 Tax=Grus japonensis TaxID=30415 RepID=A0ABC9VYY4_GRUJA
MVRQAVPLQPMVVDGGADIHLQSMEDPMLEQVEAPEGGCDPVGSLRWSRLLAGPVNPVERGAHARAVREELQLVGKTYVGEVYGGLSPMGGTPRWSKGRV